MGQPEEPRDPGFLADVRSSLRVLIAQPALPLLSMAVWGLPALLPPALAVVGLPISVFAIGYPGTERVWVLRGLRGQSFSVSEAIGLTWGFFWRFLLLSLVIAPVVLIGAGIGWLIGRTLFAGYVGGLAAGVLLDFALTFVTTALAFSTRRLREALARGLGMIRSEWPRSALYVLVPPLAILIGVQLSLGAASIRHLRQVLDAIQAGRRPEPLSQSARLVSGSVAAIGGLVSLLFKGAAAAFYARRFAIGPFGASRRSDVELPPPPRSDVELPVPRRPDVP